MKTLFLKVLFIIFAFTYFNNANAQEEEDFIPRKNVIKINPLGLLFGFGHIAYERAINERNAVLIAPSTGSFKLGNFKYASLGLIAEYRFYLLSNKVAPYGLYIAPGLSYLKGKVEISTDSSNYKINFNSFGGRGVLGYQWIFNSGFMLDLNGGLAFQRFQYRNKSYINLKTGTFLPVLGFSLGYAF